MSARNSSTPACLLLLARRARSQPIVGVPSVGRHRAARRRIAITPMSFRQVVFQPKANIAQFTGIASTGAYGVTPVSASRRISSGMRRYALRRRPNAGAGPRRQHVQRLCPPAQGGVVGNRQGETEKADHKAEQALRLAQSEMEHRLQRQRRQDRQRRIPSLPASGCPRCRLPGPRSPCR